MANEWPKDMFSLSLGVLWDLKKGEKAVTNAFAARELGVILGISFVIKRGNFDDINIVEKAIDGLPYADQQQRQKLLATLNRYFEQFDFHFPEELLEVDDSDRLTLNSRTLLNIANQTYFPYKDPEIGRSFDSNIPMEMKDGLLRTWMAEQRQSLRTYRERMLESIRTPEGQVLTTEGQKTPLLT